MPIMRKRVNAASAEMRQSGKQLNMAMEVHEKRYRQYIGEILKGKAPFPPEQPLASTYKHAKNTEKYFLEMKRRASPGRAALRMAANPKAAMRLARMKAKSGQRAKE